MEQRNLLRNFLRKVGIAGIEQTLEKAVTKTGTTERRSGSVWPRTAWTDDNIDTLLFLYSVIFVHKLSIIVLFQIYLAAILPNIIKID